MLLSIEFKLFFAVRTLVNYGIKFEPAGEVSLLRPRDLSEGSIAKNPFKRLVQRDFGAIRTSQ